VTCIVGGIVRRACCCNDLGRRRARVAYIGCFAVWTIFAIIGVKIQRQYGLTDTEFGLLVGTPFLSGSLMRVVLGVWADRHGGRRLFLGVMIVAAVATWFVADAASFPTILVGGWARGSPAAAQPSGCPTSRDGIRENTKARCWGSWAPAMWDRQLPSSARRGSCSRTAGRGSSGCGRYCWWVPPRSSGSARLKIPNRRHAAHRGSLLRAGADRGIIIGGARVRRLGEHRLATR